MKDTVYGLVNDDLGVDTLENLCVPGGIQTGPFGSQLHQKDYLPIGTPIITVEHLGENRVLHQDLPRISDEDKERLSRYVMQKGDIIFSRVGSVDRRALVRDEENGWLFSGRCLRVRPNQAKIDSDYLSWFFGLEIFRDYIRRIAVGATMPSLNTELLSNVPVFFPPLPEQRAIAGILGALDDKIELNRRMNQTLESMARAVFRQWFVENEETNIWGELSWGDIATLEYGKSLNDYKNSDGPYTVYGTNGPIGKNIEALYPSEGIIVGRKGAYRGIHYCPNPFFVIDTAFYLKPRRPFSMKWAYYELLQFDLNGMDSGSAIPSTSRTDFYNIPVRFPPQELMNSFEDFVAPLFTKIYANEKESRTLGSLRDSLLPKLMRGEVRVKA